MVSVFQIIFLIIGVAKTFIFVHFVMSWLIAFNIPVIRWRLFWPLWSSMNELLEPLYGPIRRILPTFGNMDLTPLVALIALQVLEIILRNNVHYFL